MYRRLPHCVRRKRIRSARHSGRPLGPCNLYVCRMNVRSASGEASPFLMRCVACCAQSHRELESPRREGKKLHLRFSLPPTLVQTKPSCNCSRVLLAVCKQWQIIERARFSTVHSIGCKLKSDAKREPSVAFILSFQPAAVFFNLPSSPKLPNSNTQSLRPQSSLIHHNPPCHPNLISIGRRSLNLRQHHPSLAPPQTKAQTPTILPPLSRGTPPGTTPRLPFRIPLSKARLF